MSPRLVQAVIEVESNFEHRARSRKGAMGLMQLMPSTARQYAVANPYDPRSNIDAGARHLRTLLDRFDVSRALAAYNAGEGAVRRFGGIPPYPETRSYVRRILRLVDAAALRRQPSARSARPTSRRRGPGADGMDAELGIIRGFGASGNALSDKILRWNSPAGSSPPGARSSRACTPPTREARLRHELEEKGLHVLALQPRGGIGGFSISLPRRRRISPREFLEFNQELATLLKAGMPLVQSLDLLRSGIADPLFRSVLDAVYERVKAGSALSDAFEEHGALFPRVYTASLMAGERSGSLEVVLRRYVAYTKLAGAVRRKTISALIYPAVLVDARHRGRQRSSC